MGKNEFHMMMGRRLRFIQQILHIHVVVEARLYLFLEGDSSSSKKPKFLNFGRLDPKVPRRNIISSLRNSLDE